MNDLRLKMEAELNQIPKRISAVLHNQFISQTQKAEQLAHLEDQRDKLRQLINKYILLQNQFLELTGKLSLSY